MPRPRKQKQQRTPRQQQTSRENGRKSHGPVTREGKLKSRFNGASHGLRGGPVILNGESQELFNALLHSYRNRFQPADQFETDLVFELCAIRWRQRRLWSMETAALDLAIDRRRTKIAAEFSNEIDEPTRQADAFQTLSDNSTIAANYARNDALLRRNYDRTFSNLLTAQGARCDADAAAEKTSEPGNPRNYHLSQSDTQTPNPADQPGKPAEPGQLPQAA